METPRDLSGVSANLDAAWQLVGRARKLLDNSVMRADKRDASPALAEYRERLSEAREECERLVSLLDSLNSDVANTEDEIEAAQP